MPGLLSPRDAEGIETGHPALDRSGIEEALPGLLRGIRLSGCMQFLVTLVGSWQVDVPTDAAARLGAPRDATLFHIVLDGSCWFRSDGYSGVLNPGDIVALPCGAGHQLGVGTDGRRITPGRDLPPRPWRMPPVLRYEHAGDTGEAKVVKLLCGFLWCDAMRFAPLRNILSGDVHVETRSGDAGQWLQAMIAQIAAEMDAPRGGAAPMVERLTEVVFVEILRRRILATEPASTAWLAAMTDRTLAKCLALIHDEPARDWSVQALAAECGLSRSTLADRFEAVLGTSPARYIREWRLGLASAALKTSLRPICAIAQEAGYGTEAAFSRAFSRAYGVPPGAWRENARRTGA